MDLDAGEESPRHPAKRQRPNCCPTRSECQATADIAMGGPSDGIQAAGPGGASASIGREWAAVIERVKSAIVAIRVTGVKPFEDSPAGVWQGTGFVVSLENPREALILTNRHVITAGPIRAFATFDEHEELPVWPVYRDPVHDFGLLQFDTTRLRFTPATKIPLSPSGLRVGAEVLVIGNDNSEKIQILPATIARTDRNCPEYDGYTYQDENTFYAGAGSNTSGGSSGSPVIDRTGACVALNAGGSSEAASAYYLPLDRVVYVLEWLRAHRNEAPVPPRGTVLTRFLFQPFDMLKRLGFTEEQERRALEQGCRGRSKVVAGNGEVAVERPRGLLVVEDFLPGTEAEQKLKPGDVVVEVAGARCLDFVDLAERLDGHVGKPVPFRISRAGEWLDVELQAHDLHELIPHDFVECAGGVFHQLSYHTCKRFHLPVLERGVFVVQSGFSFGLELPYHAVVTEVNGRSVRLLADFEAAVAEVQDGEMFEVSWHNPTTNERRLKRSTVRMERTLWPVCAWRFSASWPNSWHRENLPSTSAAASSVAAATSTAMVVDSEPLAPAPPSSAVATLPLLSAPESAAVTDVPPPLAAASSAGETSTAAASSTGDPTGSDVAEPLGYPPSKDATIARVQPMVCTVTTRVAHEFVTDFILSQEERKSTLIHRGGVGLVVDTERGLVLTDRYAVPQPLVHVELTFAQIITTDAHCVFIHPQHNLVLLRYDPAALQDLPVRRLDVDAAGSTEESTEESAVNQPSGRPAELAIGEVLHFVSMFGDHRMSSKQVTVGSIYLKAWPFAEPPAYRERNLEIVNLNDTFQGMGGLLVEPGATGRTRAWFAQFPVGKKHYMAGVPIPVLAAMLRPLGLFGGPSPQAPMHLAEVPTLDCEFEELSMAKARRSHGMSAESTRELVGDDDRRQVLLVARVTAGGALDGRVAEGDVILRVAGQPATRAQQIERLMLNLAGKCDGPVIWRVLRSKKQVEVSVEPSWRPSDGTTRLIVFNGLVLRPTPRAVAERGGPVMPHSRPGEGLYFWHVFAGSPADTFGLAAPGWLVEVDDEPIKSMDHLLEVVHAGRCRDREWLRCRTMDSEGRPTVRVLQPDPVFWPTVELFRCIEGPLAVPRWRRKEHRDT